MKRFDLRASTEDMTEADEGEFIRYDDVADLLAAVDALALSTLHWYQNSGPFRGVARAVLRMRQKGGAE